MEKISSLLALLTLVILIGCNRSDTGTTQNTGDARPSTREVEILQTWQGDYPVAQLNELPQDQRDRGVGYISDAKNFENVWKAFKPGEAVPTVDFKNHLVLFARNTQFYNRISIGKVKVTNGVAEVLAMETMSAIPIEDKVAVSLSVVPRKDIESIRSPDGPLVIEDCDQ